MAYRIHGHVERGEVDNREKGVVRGRIWLTGQEEPVELELKGNACPDLAGAVLRFRNRKETTPLDGDLFTEQKGFVGDLTASRRVRVWEVPVEEGYWMCKRGEKPPEHMANCVYLEWFSLRNGRVVIESTDFEVEVSEPEWNVSEEDEADRQEQMAKGWNLFMGGLGLAIEQQRAREPDPDKEEWDEFDYEALLRQSDARVENYMELIDKYGFSPEGQEQIAKEMGWDHLLEDGAFTIESGDLPEREEEGRPEWSIEELNAAAEEALEREPDPPDPHREGIDWIRMENGELRHPLHHRAMESSMAAWHYLDAQEPSEAVEGLRPFVEEWQSCAVKLAGALQGIAEGDDLIEPGFTVAYLKRALDFLHTAQRRLNAGAASIQSDPLREWIRLQQAELMEIRQGILNLMDVYRGR